MSAGDGTIDVAVVGAGAMGSAAAYRLARTGREVVVLERFALGHDRGGSHGGTRLFRMAVDSADYVRRVLAAGRLWRALEEESGCRLLEVVGAIDHGAGDRVIAEFPALFQRFGVAHEVLDPAAAAERWPGMRFTTPVLHQPESGRLLADRALRVLQDQARRFGARFHPHRPATAIRAADAGPVEIDTPAGVVRVRHVVVTAGPWAPKLLAGLVPVPRITVTQEQPRFFAPRDPERPWPAFVHWRTGAGPVSSAEAYGVYEAGAGVKVGLHATGPVVDPDLRDFRPDADVDAALLRYVEQWLPGLDPGRSRPISCLYDNTADERYVVARHGAITVATGFSGQGFKFVPLIAQRITGLVAGDRDQARIPPEPASS